ncbi:hypothetical protein ACTFIY_003040 [Dictyostelium cf. discoideum]
MGHVFNFLLKQNIQHLIHHIHLKRLILEIYHHFEFPMIPNVIGDIPESYCKLKLYLGFNELNGKVPQCVLCIGYGNAQELLPNPFSNFNSSSKPNCPDFEVNEDYTKLFTTDGNGVLYR